MDIGAPTLVSAALPYELRDMKSDLNHTAVEYITNYNVRWNWLKVNVKNHYVNQTLHKGLLAS